MFKRFGMASMMIGSFGLPYLVSSSSELWNTATSKLGSPSEAVATQPPAPLPATGHPAAAHHATAHHATAHHAGKHDPAAHLPGTTSAWQHGKSSLPPEGYAAQDLSEILQFAASPEWVMARWPRVTAGLAELDLQGYRVPLVSGTGQDDIAGSLTYYFDQQRQIARITFHGTTGDPRKLIALVTNKYSFIPQQTNDPGLILYQVRWNGKPLSELRIKPARVLRADQPYARYEVDLAMKRP